MSSAVKDEQDPVICINLRTKPQPIRDFCLDFNFDPTESKSGFCILPSVYQRHSLSALGLLGKLPLEIISQILLLIDIPSVIAFRYVNRCGLTIVDALPRFCFVLQHCSKLLRAIIATKATSFNYDTLLKSLSTSQCVECGKYAAYLYLITCRRVCYFCFRIESACLPLKQSRLDESGLTQSQIEQLPQLTSLSGHYAHIRNTTLGKRYKLFDRTAVQEARPDDDWAAGLNGKSHLRWAVPTRFMAIISVPYFCPYGSVDWGIYCPAECEISGAPPSHKFRYSRSGILAHIEEYGPLRNVGGVAKHVPLHDRQ